MLSEIMVWSLIAQAFVIGYTEFHWASIVAFIVCSFARASMK